MRALLGWTLRSWLRVTVRGETHLRGPGGRLIIANHGSLLDAVLLGALLPGQPLVVISRETAEHRFVRFLLRFLPHVVLDPARPLAVKHLIRHVEQGGNVLLFPEGRASTTGGLMKVYDAAGIIAVRCGAPVIPVYTAGSSATPFGRVSARVPRRWRGGISVTVLPPATLPDVAGYRGRERRRRLSNGVLQMLQAARVAARERNTLYQAFLAATAAYGRGEPVLEDTKFAPDTYRSLLKKCLALGRLLSRHTAPGETVGILLPNLTATVCTLLGLSAQRRVPAMLNYSAGGEAMRGACVAAGIRTIITSRRFLDAARLMAAARVLSEYRFVYLEDLQSEFGFADKLWVISHLLWRPERAEVSADPAAVAAVLFTSGSEARPKGVALSHDAILANMEQMRAVIDFGPDDKFLNALPMYHTYGLIACTLMPLMSGTRLFLYTNPLHYRLIPEYAYTRDCTYVFGTSTFLGHYGRQAHPYDFYRVRVVVCGGEKLNAEVAQLWVQRFGLRIMEGYGATECGPAMSLNTPLAYREGTVGRLLPGVEYQLTAIPGITEGGALHVRSPNLMSGYYFYDEPGVLHPPRSEVGAGWHNTGDIAAIDEDGFVAVLGRVKRFAKIAGEMISLELVERIAYQAAPAHRHAATVEQIPGSGESTILFTTAPGLDRIVLQQAARAMGAQDLAVARRIVRVTALPLLGSGKTDYVALRRMAS